VIDLRFLMVKLSSYRARSVGLGGSSPFRRGKNHDLLFHQDSNTIQDAFSIKTQTQFRMPAGSCARVSATGAHPSPPLAQVFRSGCRTLRRASLRTLGRPCVAPVLRRRATRNRVGHRKSAVLSSRLSSSCCLGPEREGRVVVI
jgi:hypothetical protein